MTLHDSKELDNDLRGRTDEDLTLAATLGVDDVVLEFKINCVSHVQHYGEALTRQSF